jgi:hypothetical protein
MTALATGAATLVAAGCAAAPAAASNHQLAMFEVPNGLQQNPTGTLQTLRSLGVGIVRVPIYWSGLAANPGSSTPPAGDPYAGADWSSYDRIVSAANQAGIAVDLMPTGPAPVWAAQPGAPACSSVGGSPVCFGPPGSPNSSDFFPSGNYYGQFVRAVGSHFPSVHFWEIWNEANWGPSLTPQYYNSSVPVSAMIYRGLLDNGFSALQSTGHGNDTISIGNLSQDGSASVGQTGTTAPLTFVLTLYCLDSSDHALTGAAANQAGCPGSTSGFRSAHPALFSGNVGVGVHPYPFGAPPPTQTEFPSPFGLEFAELGHGLSVLDHIQGAYGSSMKMKFYNTEYGYKTNPPNGSLGTTPANAAKYINQAEYLSYKNPRIGSYDQYELADEGWFAIGLEYASGAPKPGLYAYRFPVWLPKTSTKHGRSLEVWGCARAARYARQDTGRVQYVKIQFAKGRSGRFHTVKTVKITNPEGYFDVRVKFRSSGRVRLAWASNDSSLFTGQIFSRVTNIRLR